MYPCLTQVRRSVKGIVSRLFSDIPALRISIIAHGDYCDEDNPYVIKIKDFSNDENEIIKFIPMVEPTYGGDAPECYDLVFNLFAEELKLNGRMNYNIKTSIQRLNNYDI